MSGVFLVANIIIYYRYLFILITITYCNNVLLKKFFFFITNFTRISTIIQNTNHMSNAFVYTTDYGDDVTLIIGIKSCLRDDS